MVRVQLGLSDSPVAMRPQHHYLPQHMPYGLLYLCILGCIVGFLCLYLSIIKLALNMRDDLSVANVAIHLRHAYSTLPGDRKVG
jgi:hypothetical protein